MTARRARLIGAAGLLVLLAAAVAVASNRGRGTAPPGGPSASAVHPSATTSPQASGARWTPALTTPWQWVLAHPLNLASTLDMGTGVVDDAGHPAPDPVMYDIDGFTNTAATVAALHATGKRVVCYIETGAVENYRPDAAQFPASVLGRTLAGYPAERYADIRQVTVLRPLIDERLRMCKGKGFDAVEPDIDDAYAEGQTVTGFPLTMPDQIRYDGVIAQDAHALGLSIALKNGDDPAFAGAMTGVVDFALVEQCFENSTCSSFAPFTAAGKAVFEVEYNIPVSSFCAAAHQDAFNAEKQRVQLDGGRSPCR